MSEASTSINPSEVGSFSSGKSSTDVSARSSISQPGRKEPRIRHPAIKRVRDESDEEHEDSDAEATRVSRSRRTSDSGSSVSGTQLRAWEFVVHVADEEAGHRCVESIRERFKTTTKSWVMQLERGEENGRLHIQGFVSFKVGKRRGELQRSIAEGSSARAVHDSRASREYCQKPDGRVAGPWTSGDSPIPRQYRAIEFRGWQSSIARIATEWDARHIDVLYDAQGGIGKSTLIGCMCCRGQGRQLPPLNSGRDLLRGVASLPSISKLYFIDMPRAMGQSAAGWREFYGAVEMIKSGYAYDDRYKFKEKRFDSPNIWIMSNVLPNMDLLSADRWRIWHVNGVTKELQRYVVGPTIAQATAV